VFDAADPKSGHDYAMLDRMLDMVRASVFRRGDAAFYGPLLSGLNHIWSTEVDTAATDGKNFWWNPDFFLEAPIKYGCPTFNEFVMMHELDHVAKLHMLRQGTRCPDYWNFACDIRINNDRVAAGYSFGSFPAWFNPGYDAQNGEPMAEEDIYDLIFKNPPGGQKFVLPPNPWGNGDMTPDANAKTAAINNVVRAIQSAKMSGQPGAIPGGVEGLVDKFLTPIIPWELHLKRWMTELLNFDYTWRRPNRRHQDIYLPSLFQDDGKLEHLMFFQDVSGSISDGDIVRFNSELKYIWDVMKPKRMTVVQFDTIIQKIDEYHVGNPFTKIHIIGRGGTSLVQVRQKIIDDAPTAAIIFSDMYVAPMEALPKEIPILWVSTNNRGAEVPFGKLIHIDT